LRGWEQHNREYQTDILLFPEFMALAMLQTASSSNLYKDKYFIAANSGKRTSSAIWNGKPVQIKCRVYQKPTLKQRLHSAMSVIMPVSCLRAVPAHLPEDMVSLEVKKIKTFRAANIPVLDIICTRGPVLVLSNADNSVGSSLEKLRETNHHVHDSLLIQCAEALGIAHAAGLCHGRPYLHDMFLSNGRAGFLEFNEDPERVMPLAMAQARDAWFLFLQITAQALDNPHTSRAAFLAWRRHISLETLESLRKLIHFLRIFIGPLRLVRPIYLGDNGKRMLCAIEFFTSHLGL